MKGADKINKQTGVLDNRSDLVTIEIIEGEKTLASGEGSYLEHLTFGEGPQAHTVWTINDEHLASEFNHPEDKKLLLESDSCNRQDGVLIGLKKYEEAEAEKHRLEELQRHDKKLRTAAAEKLKV